MENASRDLEGSDLASQGSLGRNLVDTAVHSERSKTAARRIKTALALVQRGGRYQESALAAISLPFVDWGEASFSTRDENTEIGSDRESRKALPTRFVGKTEKFSYMVAHDDFAEKPGINPGVGDGLAFQFVALFRGKSFEIRINHCLLFKLPRGS